MTVTVGTQIQAGFGLWEDGGVPTSYTYQWQSSANGTGWADVAVATRSDYITTDADLGLYFRVGVTATNAAGVGTVTYSAAAGPVTGVPDTPTGSRRKDRRSKGGSKPHGRVR